jgi:hypothetical protein
MLPALDVAPPATQWDAATLTTDAVHHLVYALAATVAYEALEQG